MSIIKKLIDPLSYTYQLVVRFQTALVSVSRVFEIIEIQPEKTDYEEKYVEKELEESMVERIRNVLLELGNGFSFIGNQYKITVGNEDYFIDMLFYHLKLHCYIVVELKTIPFKPEFIGQLNFYLTALDEQVKDKMDAPTIGLLLCKSKDKLTVEYSLKI